MMVRRLVVSETIHNRGNHKRITQRTQEGNIRKLSFPGKVCPGVKYSRRVQLQLYRAFKKFRLLKKKKKGEEGD